VCRYSYRILLSLEEIPVQTTKPRILIVADDAGDPSQPGDILDHSIYEVKTTKTFAERL
jgi:hypothetical protein